MRMRMRAHVQMRINGTFTMHKMHKSCHLFTIALSILPYWLDTADYSHNSLSHNYSQGLLAAVLAPILQIPCTYMHARVL